MSRLDFVIFGATGFTGKCLVKEAIRISKADSGLRWGVAARSSGKLHQTLKEVQDETGEDTSRMKRMIADAADEESLKAMTALAKVVVNCCGPFRYFGEAVIRACIATNTHYVDITAEIQFMQNAQLKYHEQAEEAGVYVVSACGLDCIPTDLGTVFLQQNFKGELNSVESFMMVNIPTKYRKLGTPLVNYGTYESLINMVAFNSERESLRKQLFPKPLPTFEPKLKQRPSMYKTHNYWFLPSNLADDDIVYRTQRFFYETQQYKRPAQFRSYIGIPTRLEAFLVYILIGIAYFMVKFSGTRKLILNHPKIFTAGFVSRDGVPDEIMNSITFECVLRGTGWDETVKGTKSTKPNKTVVAKRSPDNRHCVLKDYSPQENS